MLLIIQTYITRRRGHMIFIKFVDAKEHVISDKF